MKKKIYYLRRSIPCDSRCWPCHRRGSNGASCCRRYRRRRVRCEPRSLSEAVPRDVSAPGRRTRPRADPTPSSRSRTRACHLSGTRIGQTRKDESEERRCSKRRKSTEVNVHGTRISCTIKWNICLHIHALKRVLSIISYIFFSIWKNIEYSCRRKNLWGRRMESSRIRAFFSIFFFYSQKNYKSIFLRDYIECAIKMDFIPVRVFRL